MLLARHLVTVESGAQLLSDQIISSPILMDSDGAGPSSGGGGGGGGGHEFGVDPSMDPELAMALRMSLEEEQARQRAAEGASGSAATDLPAVAEASEETTPQAGAAISTAETTAPPAPPGGLSSKGSLVLPGADALTGTGPAAQDESEEAMLQQAIALSQGGDQGSSSLGRDEDVEMGDGDEEMDEEEAIARAIEMSLKGEQDGQKK